ncbi:MAG: T9SS type A sorting domain-containing protein [Lentimicrobium sp.]|nr:T9SS type A sorting domain-containing protein [Lentimicrobium sp.]
MKKLTPIILISFLCSFGLIINAQNYIKIDASFYSEVLDEVKMIDIYLPGDYYINPEQQYATIYYLHGGGGNQNEGNSYALLYYYMQAQNTNNDSPPAIFISPDASCEPYAGSMYVNSVLYGNYEDYIMQDVIGFVESNFRAMPDKNFRMITGFSMGGYGSASLSSKYPEQFRACVPMSGGFSADSMLYNFRTRCYQEQGTYNLKYTNGYYTRVFFTLCSGFSPNMDIEPYHIEIPFDTFGNWQDSVISKWSQHEIIRRVKDLPEENELAWFLICGKQDNLAFFPSHREFTDSLDFYGIGYDTSYFEGTHEYDYESRMKAIHWMDSIIDHSFRTLGVFNYSHDLESFNVYPNPASDKLTISCQVKEAATVGLSIYNITGQLMGRVHIGFMPVGEQRFELNISDYKPGVYFCRVRMGDESVTRKIIKVQ